jgi:hypothetical protein
MKSARLVKIFVVAAVLVTAPAAPARAQVSGLELGTSLVSLMINTNDSTTTTFGVPSGGFGIVNPGAYLSVFVGPRIAVEPQIGLLLMSGGGHSAHALNLAGQVDYFFNGSDLNSPYAFGSVGVLSTTGAGVTPVSVSGGAGYRKLLGDRLTLRFDGRFTHYTQGLGNAVAFTASLGGMFGAGR